MWSFTESSVLSPSWRLPVGGEAVTFTPGLGHASTDGFLQPMTGLQLEDPGQIWDLGRHWSLSFRGRRGTHGLRPWLVLLAWLPRMEPSLGLNNVLQPDETRHLREFLPSRARGTATSGAPGEQPVHLDYLLPGTTR